MRPWPMRGVSGQAHTHAHFHFLIQVVTLADGRKLAYDALISTIPLDVTCRWLGKAEWADGLQHSSSHIVGIGKSVVCFGLGPSTDVLGSTRTAPRERALAWPYACKLAPNAAARPTPPGIRGACPHGLKCWLYFPEDDCPFYRTTVFSHYAKKNCPADDAPLPTLCLADGSAPADGSARPGPYWSLMFEISESQFKPVEKGDVTLGGTAGGFCVVHSNKGGKCRSLCARCGCCLAGGDLFNATTCAHTSLTHASPHPHRHVVRGGEADVAGRHQHAAGGGRRRDRQHLPPVRAKGGA